MRVCVLSSSVMSYSFATLWTVVWQVPLSMGFSQSEYWSGMPFPPPGDLSGPGVSCVSCIFLHWQADSLPLSHLGSPVCLSVYLSIYNLSSLFLFIYLHTIYCHNSPHPMSQRTLVGITMAAEMSVPTVLYRIGKIIIEWIWWSLGIMVRCIQAKVP